MDPPTCTVALRSVRTTGAVVTWLLPLDDVPVPLPLPATPAITPATTAPARAPAATVMAATSLAVRSAIERRPGARGRQGTVGRLGDVSAAWINLLEEAGRGCGV